MSEPSNVSTKRQRIAELAKQAPDMAMNLSHHMDLEWFREAYRRTRKDGAVGVDDQSAREYEENLDANLLDLIDRAKSGRYRAPPVKRVHIPKGSGGHETRPLGIPTFEDKVLQRAVTMALEPVYEQDFLSFSFGFRPGKSAHGALHELRQGLMQMGGGYVIDLDIRRYFDTVDHRQIQQVVRQRVRDGVLRRLIGKWLKAGVMEHGSVSYPEQGVPQGGVISPLLSNIHLDEVLDRWFAEQVRPRMRGRAFMVRYADDALLVFEHRQDAERVGRVLESRLAKYGLTLHPQKTKLVNFTRGTRRKTFDFLGFTHYWTRSRRGALVIKQKTAKDRFARSVKRISQWLRAVRHWPIREQHKVLVRKIRGHIQYFGITGNSSALGRLLHHIKQSWLKWLRRRSHKARRSWAWFKQLLQRFPLPKATPVHSTLRRVANP